MAEPIERRGAEQFVGERLAPFGELQVAGDHGGGALVALGDQIVEVLVLPGLEGLEPEVVDDKQRHPGEGLHLALDGARGTSGIDLREHVGLRGEHHIVAPSHRAVTDGLGDMALVGAAGAGNQHGDFLFDEPALGEVGDPLLIDARIEVEVEALQRLVATEAGAAQSHAVLSLFAAAGFVLDDQRQELRIGELVLDRFAIAAVEAVEDAGQANCLSTGVSSGSGVVFMAWLLWV